MVENVRKMRKNSIGQLKKGCSFYLAKLYFSKGKGTPFPTYIDWYKYYYCDRSSIRLAFDAIQSHRHWNRSRHHLLNISRWQCSRENSERSKWSLLRPQATYRYQSALPWSFTLITHSVYETKSEHRILRHWTEGEVKWTTTINEIFCTEISQ